MPRMKLSSPLYLCCFALVFSCITFAYSDNLDYLFNPEHTHKTTRTTAAVQQPSIWPSYLGVHSDNNVGMSANCFGQLGHRFMIVGADDPESNQPPPSFVYPAVSNKQYLFAGALWIGGIIDGDTIVSVGARGYGYNAPEFLPESVSGGTVRLLAGKADKQFIATYSDTVPITYYPDPRIEALTVTERSYSWVTPPYDDFIIYELNIKNVGTQPILDTWLGYYVDCDVYSDPEGGINEFGYTDDIVGLRRISGIAYITDNDGDPVDDDNSWSEDESIRGIFGLKLIDMYPPATDTSFNWWIRGGGNELDWGPRYLGDTTQPLYEYSNGGNGQPATDPDCYHLLSNSEIDYDYIWTYFMRNDSSWLPMPASLGLYFGFDARFLYSFGAFDLMPGDSLIMTFAIVGGENLHDQPSDFEDHYDLNLPEMFYYRLDFGNLENNAAAAKNLYESDYTLAPPLGPVQGVEISRINGAEYRVEWKPRSHPDLVGYNVYYAPVPDSQVFFGDTVLGTLDTSAMSLLNTASLLTSNEHIIDDLVDGEIYYLSVTTAGEYAVGRRSRPVYFTFGSPDKPVTDTATMYISSDQTITIDWTPPLDSDIDHYNIYRRIGYDEYITSYDATTWSHPTLFGNSYDSLAYFIENGDTTMLYYFKMEPYASVDAGQNCFTDSTLHVELYYFITAVDTLGQESPLSDPVHILVRGPTQKDFLIYLPNSGKRSNLQNIDSLVAFYDRALSGLEIEYDYFFVGDSVASEGCEEYRCMGWSTMSPYRFILFDDNMREAALYHEVYGSFTDALTDYVKSGGNLIYFGNLMGDYTGLFIDTLQIKYYPGQFEYDLLHVDSLDMVGLLLYTNGLIGLADTLGGLIHAEPFDNTLPPLDIDTSLEWWNDLALAGFIWPQATPPMTGCLYPRSPAEPIYYYNSLYPGSSLFEGMPCGIKYEDQPGDVYTFIMHPWYLESEDFRSLIAAVIERTPVSTPDEPELLPAGFTLRQNHPNPFNPQTVIEYYLPHNADIQIDIYNILGRRVRTLASGFHGAGQHRVTWDGADDTGMAVASGVYFYRLKTDDFVKSRKMLLLK